MISRFSILDIKNGKSRDHWVQDKGTIKNGKSRDHWVQDKGTIKNGKSRDH
jgi:hypothetical protein